MPRRQAIMRFSGEFRRIVPHIIPVRGDLMVYSFNDLKCKEIINIRNGCRIGFPDDIEFENCTAKICRLIVYGRVRCFGLFGREEDICIKWCDIKVIGRILSLFPVKNQQVQQKSAANYSEIC